MKPLANLLFAVLAVPLVSLGVFAEGKSLAELQAELASSSSWLATVEGEQSTPRTLWVKGATEQPDGTLLLDASFGWTSAGKGGPVSASVIQSGQETKLSFVTGTGSKVVSVRALDGSFAGTITYANGMSKAIKIAKISDADLQKTVDTARADYARSLFVKPAADVPADCASYSGKWTGTWSQGGIGQQWLWVLGVNGQCVSKYAYMSSTKIPLPESIKTVEIKGGALSIPCGEAGGVCVFKRHGDKLWASYTNSSGGSNNAEFERAPL